MKFMNKINTIFRNSKIRQAFLFIVMLSVSAWVVLGITSTQVFAATPGTCYQQGITTTVNGNVVNNSGQVEPCVSVFPSGKDTAGQVLSPANCYTVTKDALASPISCDASVVNRVAPAGSGDSAGNKGTYTCGVGASNKHVQKSINFGCKGEGNPILDLTFAIIRFLSTGVGIVLVGSMIWAGIQYTSSRGDPSATAKAIGRIRSNVIALLIFIFAFAILNYVVPGVFLTR